MKKTVSKQIKRISIVSFLATILAGCSLPIAKKDQGALQVTSNIAAAVHLDDQHVGQTPYFDENLKVGEYTLKLVPSGSGEGSAWQTKITIGKRVLSVLNYEFGNQEDESSYEMLELEPMNNKTATELVISTLPDNVIVKLDGDLKGFSPITFDDITPGDHTIGLEAPGYKTKTINAKVNQGHRLKITAQLARDLLVPITQASDSASLDQEPIATGEEADTQPDSSPTPSPTPSPSPKATATPTPSPTATPKVTSGITNGAAAGVLDAPFVEILETGTGWLRVRSEPTGQADNEVAKVKVGTFFTFIEKDDTGWTKLEYDTGEEGWVSSKYTRLTE